MYINKVFKIIKKMFKKKECSWDMNSMISTLLDESEILFYRQESALDLSYYDDQEVENALLSIILNESEDVDLVEECMESISNIWKRKGIYSKKIVDSIPIKYTRLKEMFLDEKFFKNNG